jgi:beta-lactamase regulating signal transducer with metallopeptidase domain
VSALTAFADVLWWHGVSSLVIACPVAVAARRIQARDRSPFLAHLLWLLVLVELVFPAFVSIRIVAVESADSGAIAASMAALDSPARPAAGFVDCKLAAAAVWLAGSALILAISMYRIVRFDRLLRLTSAPADAEIERAANEIAGRLGLARTPEVLTTSAHVSPMVWWIGGRVRIYLPAALTSRLDRDARRLVVAHELGHVRRGDQLVRWLEWLVCVACWWNPLAWWARRNLRRNEELCCDAYVVSKLGLERRRYAGSILSTLEMLSEPVVRPPALASVMNGGGPMERRILMIVSKKPITPMPRWLKAAVLSGAAVLLPLGFSVAQDSDGLDRVESWLESGVNSAYLTQEQADIMLEALSRHDRQTTNVQRAKQAAAREAVLVQQQRMEAQLREVRAVLEQRVARGEISENEVRERQRQFELGLIPVTALLAPAEAR